jgi:SAM-dependent methyltransferase
VETHRNARRGETARVDRARISSITHGDLAFHNPLAPARVDEVLGLAALRAGDEILDVGCGAGELLIRAAERFGTAGLGIDDAEIQIDAARARGADRAPGVRFAVTDAATLPAQAFDLTTCIGSLHAVDGDLTRLAAATRPGGHVLIGDGYWRRPPEQPYLDALGATADELPDYATLILNGLRFAAEHPDDPDAADARAWAERARERYLSPGGRDTLGFALVLYRRP